MDVWEVNIHISQASKLSAAAKGPEILVMNNSSTTPTLNQITVTLITILIPKDSQYFCFCF